MAVITSMNLANAMAKLVAVDTLPALWWQMVVGNLVRRDFEPTVVAQGDSVTVPVYPQSEATIALDTLVEAMFQVPDVTKIIAVPDLLRLYMQPAIVSIADSIDGHLLRLIEAQPELTREEAEIALYNAEPAAQKFLVTTAREYGKYRTSPKFSEYQTAGDAGLRELVDCSVGRLGDAFVMRSVHAKQGVMFVKDGIGMAIRRLPRPTPGCGAIAEYAELGNFGVRITMNYQPNTLAQQFTISILYGIGILRQNCAFRLSE